MFEFTESIPISASADVVWGFFTDIRAWWPPSNPEHIRIDIHDSDGSIGEGTEITFEERIAGIPGKARGSITEVDPGAEVTWEGEAVYRYIGIPFHIREGVTWRIERRGDTSELSAHVWAVFPSTLFGRFFEWFATRFLNVVARDRQHARRELEYLQGEIESAA